MIITLISLSFNKISAFQSQCCHYPQYFLTLNVLLAIISLKSFKYLKTRFDTVYVFYFFYTVQTTNKIKKFVQKIYNFQSKKKLTVFAIFCKIIEDTSTNKIII